MMRRVSAVLAVAGLSCVGGLAPNAIPPPDVDRLVVFYPLEGLVTGHGAAGSFPAGVTHARISAHPSGTHAIQEVGSDGSFSFSILAISDDVLEISGATDPEANHRGAIAYVRVPPTPLPPVAYVCCTARGTCQRESDARENRSCPDPATGIDRCGGNADCGRLSGELIPFPGNAVTVSAPDERGEIRVENLPGMLPSGALVRLENRGQRAIGGHDDGARTARITDERGVVSFAGIRARGDDELVLQVHDLLGYRSREVAILVPDAELLGLDVVGAYAFRPLMNGKRGTIAVRVSPFGVDQRGICPDTALDPVLCFTGGVQHSMLTIQEAIIGDPTASAAPAITATSASIPNNRGTEGDVLSGPRVVMIVVDLSSNSSKSDPKPAKRFNAVANFVGALPSRDHVGIVSYGGPPRLEAEITLGNRDRLVGAIQGMAARELTGTADVFDAIRFAAEAIRNSGRRLPGDIVLVALDNPSEEKGFETALDSVAPNASGFLGFRTHILGVNLSSDGTGSLLNDIATFSGGKFVNIASSNALVHTAGELLGPLAGSYVLLYDVDVPRTVGKMAELRLTIEMRLPTAGGDTRTAIGQYAGLLEVSGSSNP